MSKFIAAIDQGTTSTRCILFNHNGEPVAMHQKEHRQICPRPGWVEHDPVEIWTCTQEVITGVLKESVTFANDIAAIGVANQRETVVVWHRRTGRPLYNAIVWQDTRTDEICHFLAGEGGKERFQIKTGLPLTTYFSGPKVRWILDHIDGARDAVHRGDIIFGNMDAWIIWNQRCPVSVIGMPTTWVVVQSHRASGKLV